MAFSFIEVVSQFFKTVHIDKNLSRRDTKVLLSFDYSHNIMGDKLLLNFGAKFQP